MLPNDVTYSIPWINVNLVLLHKLYNVDAIRFASMIYDRAGKTQSVLLALDRRAAKKSTRP